MYSTPEQAIQQPGTRADYRTARRRRRPAAALLAAAVAVVAGVGAGCQWQKPRTAEPTNLPIVVDEAMELRQWETSRARWADSSMDGWTTRYPYTYETNAGHRQYAPYVLDSLAFVYQFFRLPFTYICEPPFAPKTYTAVEYEPSYTAIGRFMPESGAYVIDRGNAAGQAANATDASSATPADATPGTGEPGTGTPGVPGGRAVDGAGTPGGPSGTGGSDTGTPGGGGGAGGSGSGSGSGSGTGAGGGGAGGT